MGLGFELTETGGTSFQVRASLPPTFHPTRTCTLPCALALGLGIFPNPRTTRTCFLHSTLYIITFPPRPSLATKPLIQSLHTFAHAHLLFLINSFSSDSFQQHLSPHLTPWLPRRTPIFLCRRSCWPWPRPCSVRVISSSATFLVRADNNELVC